MPTLDWLTRRADEQTAGRVPYWAAATYAIEA